MQQTENHPALLGCELALLSMQGSAALCTCGGSDPVSRPRQQPTSQPACLPAQGTLDAFMRASAQQQAYLTERLAAMESQLAHFKSPTAPATPSKYTGLNKI